MPTLKDESVHCCVTSPPYWGLRDYGYDAQIGLEANPDAYVAKLVAVFREVRRVLATEGSLWLVIGDSYNANGRKNHGSRIGFKQMGNRASANGTDNNRRTVAHLKPKDLVGIPWRVAFALQADGWWLRQDIIWAKPNAIPESVIDRLTKSHEYVFLLTKSARYYFDQGAIAEPAATNDVRRPYGSQGSWLLDGRPQKMRPNGKPRGKGGKTSFRGQGHFRNSDKGPANRQGREMRDLGAGLTRRRRSVLIIPTEPCRDDHFATFPTALVELCIKAGCPNDGVVFDPFVGSGTTLIVAKKLGYSAIGIEQNPEYCEIAAKRLGKQMLLNL